MKKIKSISMLAAIAAVTLSACSDDATVDGVENASEEITPLQVSATQLNALNTQQQFCLNIFEGMNNDISDNFIVSPLGVSMVTSVVANAADDSIQTVITDALGFNSLAELNDFNQYLMQNLPKVDPSRVTVNLANAMWCNNSMVKNVSDDFTQAYTNNYSGLVYMRDFSDTDAIAGEINNWAAENTNNFIKEVVTSNEISSTDVMYIYNALYFNGKWRTPFKKENTKTGEFYDQTGAVVCNADLMKQSVNALYSENELMQSVTLGYGQNNGGQSYEMLIVLPKDDTDLTAALRSALASTSSEYYNVDVTLPKFEFFNKKYLSKYFAQSGIKLWKVNLPAINQKVDNIVVAQTAKIKVDEEGTEAAAITNTTDFSTANDKKVFTANRTFAYVIRESASKAILFMGKITDPSQTKSND